METGRAHSGTPGRTRTMALKRRYRTLEGDIDEPQEGEGNTLRCLECGVIAVIEARGFAWETAPGRLMLVKGKAPAEAMTMQAVWVRCANGHAYAVTSEPWVDGEGGESP